MKSQIAAVVAMISLVGVSADGIDFNSGWEWRRGDEKAGRVQFVRHGRPEI